MVVKDVYKYSEAGDLTSAYGWSQDGLVYDKALDILEAMKTKDLLL
jgi:hypothetical protein